MPEKWRSAGWSDGSNERRRAEKNCERERLMSRLDPTNADSLCSLHPKVDEFVPHTQLVNLRKVC